MNADKNQEWASRVRLIASRANYRNNRFTNQRRCKTTYNSQISTMIRYLKITAIGSGKEKQILGSERFRQVTLKLTKTPVPMCYRFEWF